MRKIDEKSVEIEGGVGGSLPSRSFPFFLLRKYPISFITKLTPSDIYFFAIIFYAPWKIFLQIPSSLFGSFSFIYFLRFHFSASFSGIKVVWKKKIKKIYFIYYFSSCISFSLSRYPQK